ncbi:MAG: hypothetical protein AB7G75_10960 [Candidatus Binatia bacterium]
MTDDVVALETFLASGGIIQTRIRERSEGEIHDCVIHPSLLPGVSLHGEQMVAALEELARRGTVTQSEVVHRYDSSEYRIIWRASAPQ